MKQIRKWERKHFHSLGDLGKHAHKRYKLSYWSRHGGWSWFEVASMKILKHICAALMDADGQVIWFGICPDGETVQRVSYGKNKKLCDQAAGWLPKLWEAFCKIVDI